MPFSIGTMLMRVVVVVLLWVTHAQAVRNPGWIYPSMLELEVGASANISCRLNPSVFHSQTSANLYFEETNTKNRVPKSSIVQVNATTIVFMLQNAVEQETVYICKCGNAAIMEAKVFVGSAPREVQDFQCVNNDFKYMECSFRQPPNPILTQYNLSYYLDRPSYTYYPVCNYERKPLIVCNTTLSDKNVLHREYALLHFILRASNSLGKPLTQRFDVDLLETTKPAAPGLHLRELELTSRTLHVAWPMPTWCVDHYRALQWEVLLLPDDRPAQNLSLIAGVQRVRNDEFNLFIELPYAFYWYELQLRVKVREATTTRGEDMWSPAFKYRFQSEARIPDRPPSTNAGSFYVDSTETHVRLYWEQLLPHEQNGDNFTYVVSEVRQQGKVIELQPEQLELNSALFKWQKDVHYQFAIQSRNHVGVSRDASYIEIHPLAQRNQKRYTPPAIHNVYHAYNRTYTLTWESPQQRNGLSDYTVYWCYSKHASQNECKGSIHFQRVDNDTYTYTTTPQPANQEHTLNLAVSANYEDYNTGMHWTPCTMDVNSELAKMQPEVQTTSAHTLKVRWGLEHICLSILVGYNLTYCEVLPPTLDDEHNQTAEACVPDSERFLELSNNERRFELSHLQPNTLYKVQMYMYSAAKASKISDPVFARTYEAAPSPPRQVRVERIRMRSAVVYWLPPSQTNGRIRYYTISCNERTERVNVTTTTMLRDENEMDDGVDEDVHRDMLDAQGRISYTLRNLSSFTAYKVYVTAHTVESSPYSNDVHFTTLVGFPSKPGTAVQSHDTHNSSTLIEWTKPVEPSGRLEYYEVAVTLSRNDEQLERYVSVVFGGTSCLLSVPPCTESDMKTTIEVRAVNAALLANEVGDSNDDSENDGDNYSLARVTTEEGSYYEQSERLRCVGGQQLNAVALLERYRDKELYRLYKSPWQMGPTYGCAENRMSKITTIALGVIVCFVAMLAMCYMARRQYNKMANINCTLPAGLDAYISKDTAFSAIDYLESISAGGQTAVEEVAAISGGKGLDTKNANGGDYNSYHNEKHHLLDAMSMDSAAGGIPLDMPAIDNGQHMQRDSELLHITGGYARTVSQSTAETYVESLTGDAESDVEASNAASNGMSELQCIAEEEPYVQMGQLLPAQNPNGYVQPNNIRQWALQQQQHQQQQQKPLLSDNYVKIGSEQTNGNATTTTKENWNNKQIYNVDGRDEDESAKSTFASQQYQLPEQCMKTTTTTKPNNSGYVCVDSLQASLPKPTTTTAALHNSNMANNNTSPAATTTTNGYVQPAQLQALLSHNNMLPATAATTTATNATPTTTAAAANTTQSSPSLPPPSAIATTTIPAGNGYTSLQTLCKLQQQQQQSVNDGYSIFNNNNNNNNNSNSPMHGNTTTQSSSPHTIHSQSSPNASAISGYVTQRQLTAYGHQQQMN